MLRLIFLPVLLGLCGCVVYGGYYYSYDPYAPSSYTYTKTTYVYDEPTYRTRYVFVDATPTIVYYDYYWWFPDWWVVWTLPCKEYHYYYDCHRNGFHPTRYRREHRSPMRGSSSNGGHFFGRSRSGRIFR